MAQDLTGLNSLRQALTPYEDVKFELNLNRHPKAHKNKSLVYAENMKLSKDGSVLENEESIVKNDIIKNCLEDAYPNRYDIIHIIPCNTELVLFIKGDKNTFNIWRYREKTNNYDEKIARFYKEGIVYNGGKFSSTFTYTSNDSLIIAFCEYDSILKKMNPMMTINLGTFTKGYLSPTNVGPRKYDWISSCGEFTDRSLEPYKLPICPEINLPVIIKNYVTTGNCYKGTYYFYIRYKINNYDYTQWFNFGYPIILDHKSNSIINKKMTINSKGKDTFGEDLTFAVETKYLNNLELNISDNVDLVNNSIFINLGDIDTRYDTFDIGVICVANTYTKYYVIENLSKTTDNINIDIDKMKEEIFNTNIYENYYNVKNIINKNNKLYIANYETSKNKQINVDNVKLNLIKNLEIIEEQVGIKDTVSINGISIPKEDYINVDYSVITIARDKTTQAIFTSPGAPSSGYNKAKFINLCYYLNYIGCKHLIKESINIKYVQANNGLDGRSYLTNVTKTIDPRDFYISIHKLENDTVSDDIKLNTGEGLFKNTGFVYVIANKASIHYIKTAAENGTLYNPTKYEDEDIPAYDQQAGDGLVNFTWAQINNGANKPSTYDDFCSNDIIIIDEEDITSKLQGVNNINPSVPDYNPYAQLVDGKINDNIITSLCKGEIYDFYIHFIDKYGYISDGYRLTNNNKQYYCSFNNPSNNKTETYEICFINNIKRSDGNNSCYMIPKTLKIYYYNKNTNKYQINLETWCCLAYTGGNATDGFISSYTTVAQQDVDRIKSLFETSINVSDYHKEILTWGDICDYIPEALSPVFIDYTNIENHKLFRVPNIVRQYYSGIKKGNDVSFALTVDIATVDTILSTYDFKSFFISHAKLEKTYLLDGFGDKNYMTNILLNNKANKIGNIVKQFHIPLTYWEDFTIPMSINNIDISSSAMEIFPNVTNNIAYAEDGQKYRSDRHTCVYFNNEFDSEITPNLFTVSSKTNMNRYNIFYLKTLNINKSIYINKNVKLYRLGNILNNSYSTIKDGLNGIYKYHLGFWYGDKENGVVDITSQSGLTSYGHNYLFKIYDFYDDDENIIYLAENAKSVHIKGEKTESGGSTKEIDEKEIFYPVINTLNLFNYKVGNIYDTWINFYNIYNPNSDYLTEFNRTIYRSQVISDEGKTNNWRYFENDAYKNIEENKGNITNLLAIGNYLYVHTEHSLFAFSEDNTLSMNNQNLQVATPDIFDTEYKEVFITKLGYGGLQDKNAWVAGQFGYIWFDRDSKKIFKVYGNSMDIISNDIQEWLDNANINEIKFANDIKNNRILIYFVVWNNDEEEINIVISYNILSKTFISFHSNIWFKSYNTKNNLYYLSNNTTISQYNKDSYGKNLNDKKNYSVSFIVNSYYREIKYLEHIIFKLRQRNIRDINDSFNIITDYSQFPVEKYMLPFQPKCIRVYNDLVDTGFITCNSIDKNTRMPKNNVENYQTPYWDLGNWNFSFLRDDEHYPNDSFDGNYESRLFGNYFVITFNFGYVDTLIEFENLDVQLTKDKNL